MSHPVDKQKCGGCVTEESELKAQGLDSFSRYHMKWADHYEQWGVTDGSVERHRNAAQDAADFAVKLRNGKES